MMTTAAQKRRQTLTGMTAFFCVASVAAVILFKFSPELYGFYPRCPIREVFHIDCPGCGSTRAIAALLHGDFASAFHFNPFTIAVVLPIATLYAVITFMRVLRGDPNPLPNTPASVTYCALALAMAFTVFRNL